MKSSLYRALYCLLVSVVVTGCLSMEIYKDIRVKTPCFILLYFQYENIEVRYEDGGEMIFEVVYNGDAVAAKYSVKEDADNSYILNSYSARYGDTAYNRESTINSIAGITDKNQCAHVPDIVRISVISDADFDNVHPAGSELGDIIHWSSCSRYPYIQNGYRKVSDGWYDVSCPADSMIMNLISKFECYTPVFKRMDELTVDDGKLMGHLLGEGSIGYMTFIVKPTLAQRHDFTLKMEGVDGTVYTAEFSYDFGGVE